MVQTRAGRIIQGLTEEETSYYVVADPKEADKIKASKKDDKAAFRGTADDAKRFVKDKMRGKDAVLMKRTPKGEYEYVVGEGYGEDASVESTKDLEDFLLDKLSEDLGISFIEPFHEAGIKGNGVVVRVNNKVFHLTIKAV